MIDDKRSDDINKKLFYIASSFYENNKAVHIALKNGNWENGFIKEANEDFLILELFPTIAKKKGIPYEAYFFQEIESISIYIYKKEENKNG